MRPARAKVTVCEWEDGRLADLDRGSGSELGGDPGPGSSSASTPEPRPRKRNPHHTPTNHRWRQVSAHAPWSKNGTTTLSLIHENVPA